MKRQNRSASTTRSTDGWVGCLALLDPGGESPEDRRLEAYASRAAAAYVHAAQHQRRR